MSPESDETTGGADSFLLGRRSLLKKAAVGGGLALSAPILISSFSPAAACSVTTISSSGLVTGNTWSDITPGGSANPSNSPSVGLTVGVVAIPVVIVHSGPNNPPDPSITKQSGTALLGAFTRVGVGQFTFVQPGNAATRRTTYLYVFYADVTTAGTAVFQVNLGTTDWTNFLGHVVMVTGSAGVVTAATGTASGTGVTATAPLVGANTALAELSVFASTGLSTWSESEANFTEQTDGNSDGPGNDDLSLATYFSRFAQASMTATQSVSSPWGSTAIELQC